jgi:hypothetical protein
VPASLRCVPDSCGASWKVVLATVRRHSAAKWSGPLRMAGFRRLASVWRSSLAGAGLRSCGCSTQISTSSSSRSTAHRDHPGEGPPSLHVADGYCPARAVFRQWPRSCPKANFAKDSSPVRVVACVMHRDSIPGRARILVFSYSHRRSATTVITEKCTMMRSPPASAEPQFRCSQ